MRAAQNMLIHKKKILKCKIDPPYNVLMDYSTIIIYKILFNRETR